MKRFNKSVLAVLAMGAMLLLMASCSDDKAPYSASTDLVGKWYLDRIMVISDTAATKHIEPTDTIYYCEMEFKADSTVTISAYDINYTTNMIEWSSYDLNYRENANLIYVGYGLLQYPYVFDEEEGVIHTAVDDVDANGNDITIYYYYEKEWF